VVGSSGKVYLAAIPDLFSRFIVGWAVSAVNDRHVTIAALEAALTRRSRDRLAPSLRPGLDPWVQGAVATRARFVELK